MNIINEEGPQLIISALVIIGIFVLLALRIIPPDNPFFVGGSSGLLLLVVSYWLANGHLRLQHAQITRSIAQQQTQTTQLAPALETLPPAPEPKPIMLNTTTEPIQVQPSGEPAQ